eukprot:360704-Chlamydomonas_euryale.AAC.1
MSRVWFPTSSWRPTPTADQLTPHTRAATGTVASEWLAATGARLPRWTGPQPLLPVEVPAENALVASQELAETVCWRPDPTHGRPFSIRRTADGSSSGGRPTVHHQADGRRFTIRRTAD